MDKVINVQRFEGAGDIDAKFPCSLWNPSRKQEAGMAFTNVTHVAYRIRGCHTSRSACAAKEMFDLRHINRAKHPKKLSATVFKRKPARILFSTYSERHALPWDPGEVSGYIRRMQFVLFDVVSTIVFSSTTAGTS